MPLFENNLSPYLTIVEATEPAAPSAGQQRLYIDSTTHLLKATNSSGTDRTIEGVAAGAITTSGLTQATARLLGRTTASTGAVEEITVGTGLSLSAGALTATGGGGGALALIEQHDAAGGVSTLDFTSFISSTYDEYLLEGVALAPATNGVNLVMEMGTGGGPTWDTGSNHFGTTRLGVGGGSAGTGGGTGGNTIGTVLGQVIANNAGYGICSFTVRLYNPQNTSNHKHTLGMSIWHDGAQVQTAQLGYLYAITTAVTGVRFLMSSGNIASGIIRAYGVAK